MTATLPSIDVENNFSRVEMTVGNTAIMLAFSYRTLIAFRVGDNGLVARKNVWGPTTAKHLNRVSFNHDDRVDSEEFARLYAEHMESIR